MADQFNSLRSASCTEPTPVGADNWESAPLSLETINSISKISRVQSAPGFTNNEEAPKISIGVCAMSKKARSKPMVEIIKRLLAYGEFEVITFGDEMLGGDYHDWPVVQCLLAWHSENFPLKKAQRYAALRKPYLVNDVFAQDILLDRRRVYARLMESGIPVPPHIVVDRDGFAAGEDPPGFVEGEDYVEVDGQRIEKPFVEKPVSGEDHNIYIYYPFSMGGGVKKLFRKVNNRSADYDSKHPGTVRRDSSYIYEQFLPTGGTDVKVYTVGPRYAHAEARKSPVVDGKVQRAPDGKEVRYPVLLSPQEKETARMVSLAFGQRVCGFDLLRSDRGRSYVCDVNGWSFVKNSHKYYDDAAGILRLVILSALAPHRLLVAPPEAPRGPQLKTLPPSCLASLPGDTILLASSDSLRSQGEGAEALASVPSGSLRGLDEGEEGLREDEELRCVLAVVRHGDRTPKQKLKMRVTQPALLALCVKYMDAKGKQAKLKSPSELQDLLDATRSLLLAMEVEDKALEEKTGPGFQLPNASGFEPPCGVVEKGSSPHALSSPPPVAAPASRQSSAEALPSTPGPAQRSSSTPQPPPSPAEARAVDEREELREKFRIVRSVLEQGGQFAGINRKVQLKPLRWAASEDGPGEGAPPGASPQPEGQTPRGPSPSKPRLVEALLILKHGGVLTHAGRGQAEALGSLFRNIMYPQHGPAGGGLLRLHSTYRHDLKIYSSDEGRVQSSAAAFTKGLLDLEGSALTPIFVSLVTKDAGMLDAFGKGASEDIRRAKQELYEQMTFDPDTNTSLYARPHSTTPLVSPPMSPRPLRRSADGDGTEGSFKDGPGGSSSFKEGIHTSSSFKDSRSQESCKEGSGPIRAESGGEHPTSTPTDTSADEREGSKRESFAAAALKSAFALFPHKHRKGGSGASSGKESGKHDRRPPSLEPDARAGTTLRAAARALEADAASEPHRAQERLGAGSAAGTPPLPPGSAPTPPRPPLPSRASQRPFIPNMPEAPLQTLRRMHVLLQRLVERLGGVCGGADADVAPLHHYSVLNDSPADWHGEVAQPCSGERKLLMFDRWRKLSKAFYSEKKQEFDISKVPDIYDAAKYDAIHNAHFAAFELRSVFKVAKILADAVIPNEYGIDAPSKLRIATAICSQLLGKLLADLASMRDESVATYNLLSRTTSAANEAGAPASAGGAPSPAQPATPASAPAPSSSLGQAYLYPDASSSMAEVGEEEGVRGAAPEEDDDADDGVGHRLCPAYAQNVNSPLRHVRTRIYFTSESHMHSLMNILHHARIVQGEEASLSGGSPAPSPTPEPASGTAPYLSGRAVSGELTPAPSSLGGEPVLPPEAQATLDATRELDYMTHCVIRMFENKRIPIGDPARFRMEVLFSPGAAFNPTMVVPVHNNHTLPIAPRIPLHMGAGQAGISLATLEGALKPYAKTFKRSVEPYKLRSQGLNSHTSEIDYWM